MIERRPRSLRRHSLRTPDHLEQFAANHGLPIVRGKGWLSIDAPGSKMCARENDEQVAS